MTHVHCVSCVSISSVLLAVEILRKNDKASSLCMTVVHKTLKVLPHGVNLCRRNATLMITLEGAERLDLQHHFLFWTS